MIYALIDIGSNTMRMNMYKCENNTIHLLFGTKEPAGLAGYVDYGVLSQKGIDKAISVLRSFQGIVSNFQVDQLYVFATASLRNIANSNAALKQIKKATELEIDLLSGEDEAILDFIGAIKVTDMDDGIVVDIGGGSTEIVTFKERQIINAASIPIGSLNLYKHWVEGLLPTKEEQKKIKREINKELDLMEDMMIDSYDSICGVGGTIRGARKLNNAAYDLPDANGLLEVKKIKKVLKRLGKDDRDAVDQILKVVPDRVHTIIPGMMILKEVAKRFEAKDIHVSQYGVREGYLYDKVLKEKVLDV
ncbi:phosphatase [Alkalibacter rhizosphaerae]|uniref:Phosphatase n=1 Tax=Alkalibacter rhizosphaerae TaxID=2815577 RepID=A0A974XFX6_9FIRM|nr:phosphatase [Alkalibacter rhizosphaerae]QSX09122.1 phosphatase [Alkalibacter rhizosphaerae]